jgi:nucleotide-binding universal stress UspA family protein
MVKDIVVCVDGSQQAEEAFDQAVDLAKGLGVPLRLLTVVPVINLYYLTASATPVPDDEQVRYHWELATRMIERAKARGVSEAGFAVLEGSPVDAILEHLEREPAGLLVVGARGLSRTQRLLLGSVSTALVQQAHCSVLVAKTHVHATVPSRPAPTASARRLRSPRGELSRSRPRARKRSRVA